MTFSSSLSYFSKPKIFFFFLKCSCILFGLSACVKSLLFVSCNVFEEVICLDMVSNTDSIHMAQF